MALSDIRPVIITRDAARTIVATLTSLAEFPEVVVYDNGSEDATLDLVSNFTNVRLITGEFLGFGPTKNHAASLAAGDWILSIDADESVSPMLLASLDAIDLDNPKQTYSVHRHNLFMGRDIRWGGWGNDWLVRVYHRGYARLSDALVHEKVIVPPDVKPRRIEGALWHDNISDIDQLLQKISDYTELRRQEVGGKIYSPAWTLLRTVWAFLRSYVLKLGVLAGWRGLVIATSDAVGTFFKHMKRYSDDRGRRD